VEVEATPDGSVLTLLSVGRTDSGNYTCYPANAQQAVITLHIILGQLGIDKVNNMELIIWIVCIHNRYSHIKKISVVL